VPSITKNTDLAWKNILHAKENDSIRDYTWYPHMRSNDPSTCLFASTSREQPIHLWDAYNSQTLRASYRAYDHVDALESAQCILFSQDGERILGGYARTRSIKIFHTSVPGRNCDAWMLPKKNGQQGYPSAMAFMETMNNNVIIVGTYAGSIFVYDDRASSLNEEPTATLMTGIPVVSQSKSFARKRRFVAGHEDGDMEIFTQAKTQLYQKAVRGGITQLKSLPQFQLLSASRRSNNIALWDLRMLSGIDDSRPIQGLQMYSRSDNCTNQHLQFDVDPSNTLLFTPCLGKKVVKVYNITSAKLISTMQLGSNSIPTDNSPNGVSHSPTQTNVLAVSTGTRHFSNDGDKGSDQEDTEPFPKSGLLQLYNLHI